jgi:hypothetical protein
LNEEGDRKKFRVKIRYFIIDFYLYLVLLSGIKTVAALPYLPATIVLSCTFKVPSIYYRSGLPVKGRYLISLLDCSRKGNLSLTLLAMSSTSRKLILVWHG